MIKEVYSQQKHTEGERGLPSKLVVERVVI